EQLDEVVEREIPLHEPRERIPGPAGVQEQDRQRSEIGEDQPATRPGQQQPEAKPWPSVEGGSEPPSDRVRRTGRRRRRGPGRGRHERGPREETPPERGALGR